MKYILIANTGAHRALDKVVTSNFGYEHTYLFREIWSMEDAYKLQGMELFDLVWGQIPRAEVRHYVETRVRMRLPSKAYYNGS